MREQHSKKCSWLGSLWTCHKRRRHYLSFCRNGITISVHDFIYVLDEENKRLVAYIADLYEDSRSNKMVVVRWFHKIDEVGIVLPPDFNDREIFFSLCLQDLSVECIDGLATILSPQHFEKFQNQATNMRWEPFMCHRQFDNEDITPFDIAQVQGYWEQDTVRYINSLSNLTDSIPDLPGHCLVLGDDDSTKTRPRKKVRRSKSRADLQLVDEKEVKESGHVDVENCFNDLVDSICCAETSGYKEVNSAPSVAVVGIDKLTPGSDISVGCHVEVLSQDSGIRGCWFGGVVLKSNKNKVKVCYQDVKDAIDEANSLEEWVLASRVVVPDKLGFRLHGRGTVRPRSSTTISLGPIKVGASVDAWWHNGWWEGVVVHNESDERVHVYFPEHKGLNFHVPGVNPECVSQVAVTGNAGNQQSKSRPLGVFGSKKQHKCCSYCILDVLNSPIPDFPPNEEVVGVITKEDVIEELLQEEILDETDEYINIHNRIKVNMQPSQGKVSSLNSPAPSPISSSTAYMHTPTLQTPYNFEQHSPGSPQLVAPGPTPTLSIFTGTTVASPTMVHFQDTHVDWHKEG